MNPLRTALGPTGTSKQTPEGAMGKLARTSKKAGR